MSNYKLISHVEHYLCASVQLFKLAIYEPMLYTYAWMHCKSFMDVSVQCLGQLLLKVLHYNIALLAKKVTNCFT